MNTELPEKFEEFGEARKAGFLRVKQRKEEGGLVAGIFCAFTPLEILDAAGFTAVSLCGMSEETIPAAEAHLPRNLCPLIKSSYGFALTDRCPYTYFSDLIVGETTCDGKKKMYELLGERKPTFVLHLPQGSSPDAGSSWTAELHRLIAFLEERFHVTCSDSALREAVRVRNAERRARLGLMELQKQVPPPMSGLQLYRTLEGAGFLFDSRERIEKMDQLRESVKAGPRQDFRGARRVLVTGCPIGGVLEKTVGALEEAGCVVVCFENCSGIRPAIVQIDPEAEDIVRAIAEGYLEIGCAVMTPNLRRMDLIERLVREYQVEGILEVDLQACTPYAVESLQIRRLAERLGIPCLVLETDYSQSDSAQIRTRLEAFREVMG